MKKIIPETASGFKDYLPEEMIQRNQILEKVKLVFERFGYSPLETPAIEKTEVLVGEEGDNIIFNVSSSKADLEANKDLSLRFDLTVPLARVVAQNISTIPKPFRRYQLGKAWRGERPQKGRYREFMQFDADIVGTDNMVADAEIIWMITEIFNDIGIDRVLIRFNNRKILNGLALKVDLSIESGDARKMLQIIDKIDKIGWDGVKSELQKSLSLTAEKLKIVEKYLGLKSANAEDTLSQLQQMLADVEVASEGIGELIEIVKYLDAAGVSRDKWRIDTSIARGLGYYTGPVFETNLLDAKEYGSVMSGGRYDGLVSRFSDAKLPAVGISLGVDRLFAGLQEIGMLPSKKTVSDVLIINFEPSLQEKYISLAKDLRNVGICAEIYVGKEKSFKPQLDYALNLGIPIVLIMGGDEAARGIVQIKDTRTREQKEVKLSELVGEVKRLLEI